MRGGLCDEQVTHTDVDVDLVLEHGGPWHGDEGMSAWLCASDKGALHVIGDAGKVLLHGFQPGDLVLFKHTTLHGGVGFPIAHARAHWFLLPTRAPSKLTDQQQSEYKKDPSKWWKPGKKLDSCSWDWEKCKIEYRVPVHVHSYCQRKSEMCNLL